MIFALARSVMLVRLLYVLLALFAPQGPIVVITGVQFGIALSNRWTLNFVVTPLLLGFYLAIVSRRREITVLANRL